ncbi:MAG: DUF2179 domain-containing protein [Candidatus Methanoperedens sp.]|nr:DUF2179 domain-containing protein [Candidatus Methanoperedens sp.]
MVYSIYFNSQTFSLIILPVLIFTSRIIDVTFGTLRIIFISRGEKFIAPVFGFFEILIWLLAIAQVMTNLTNVTYYLAYAGGFAMGTFVGIYLEEKLAMGILIVRIITKKEANELVENLKSKGYGVTSFDGQGAIGPVKLIFTTIKRKDVDKVVEIIKRFNPKAFYSIEEVRSASEGIFPVKKPGFIPASLHRYRHTRPGK